MPRLKTVILEAFDDEEFGILGLRIMGAPSGANAANEGLMIAHDLVEHVNGVQEIGSIDDELEALGAIWYVRGQYGDLRRDHIGSALTVHQNIAGDVTRMFRDYFYGAPVNTAPIRTQRTDADAEFEAIIREALKSTRGELDTDDKEGDAATIEAKERAYMAACLPRMRRGFRKAARKYKSGMTANRLFWDIADAVEPYAKHPECEGMQYRLTYGIDSDGYTRAYCEEYYGDEE